MTADDFFRAIKEYRQFVLADKKIYKLYAYLIDKKTIK